MKNMTTHARSEGREFDQHTDDDDGDDDDDDEAEKEMETRIYYILLGDDVTNLKTILGNDPSLANHKFHGSNQLGKSCLHLCCEKGSILCAELLLEMGANPCAVDGWYQTPLMYGVCTMREDIVTLLAQVERANINQQDRFGKTALHYAVQNNDLACARILVELGGADVASRDERGKTALWLCASQDGCLEILDLLLQNGSCVNVNDVSEKRGALQAAILHSDKQALVYARKLIKAGADVNNADSFCHNALMSIIRRSQKGVYITNEEMCQIASLLIDSGCDVNYVAQGRHWYQFRGTVLKMAVLRGCLPLVSLLLDKGANPNLKDDRQMAPLHHAVQAGRIDMVRELIKHNCHLEDVANISLVGSTMNACSACHLALLLEHWNIVDLLVSAGYTLNQEQYLRDNIDVPLSLTRNCDLWLELRHSASNPRLLVDQCILFIRSRFGWNGILKKVDQLPLPAKMKDILLLNHLI